MSPWQLCVFVSALSQTSSDSQSGGNTHTRTHTQSHSCSHSHLLEGKPNKDSNTNMHREGAGGKKKRGEPSWIVCVNPEKNQERNKQKESKRREWERWKQAQRAGRVQCAKMEGS